MKRHIIPIILILALCSSANADVTLPGGGTTNYCASKPTADQFLQYDTTGCIKGAGTGAGITALTSDVTASGTGSVAATIASGAVSLSKMANLTANTMLGNNTGSAATPIALTSAQIKTFLGYYTSADVGSAIQGYNANLTTYAGLAPSANAQTLLGHTFGQMQTDLSLVPGTNVQAYSATLATYAGVSPSANAQTLLGHTFSQMQTDLSLVPGTNVQAYNATLAAVAGGTYTGAGSITTVGTLAAGTVPISLLNAASQAQGDIIYFNGTNWVRLPAGTNGYFLKTQGAGANPTWVAAPGGLSGSTGSTDKAILIANGTGGSTLQASGILTDASNNLNLPTNSCLQINGVNYLCAGTDGTSKITLSNNTTISPTAATNEIYFEGNVLKVNQNGTEYSAAIGPTGTQISFSGTLTNGKLCTFATGGAISCNTDTSGFTGGTLTSALTLKVGAVGVGAGPLYFQTGGALLTAPAAGAMEVSNDGNILYYDKASGPTRMTIPLAPATGPVTIAGPSAARTVTFPDADFTVATLGANTFTGTQALGSQNLTTTGSISTTGSRVTKIWTTDIESTNAPTVNGNAAGSAGGLALIIGKGTVALGTSAISSATCATVVQSANVAAIATTDLCDWGFNGDPTGVTGYAASANGMLTIIAYPTSGYCNVKVCNNTSASITPGAITLNWAVRR